MPQTPMSHRLTCPRCGETILAEDKFCFHCGRRLATPPDQSEPLPPEAPKPTRRFTQWPLALAGVAVLVLAGFEVHHQSQIIAKLRVADRAANSSPHRSNKPLKPVVSTTTTYPSNLPSSASWTPEVETYHNVQFGVRVPVAMNKAVSASSNQWTWGQPNTPYQVVLAVVVAKPASANVPLGAKTYGTPMKRNSTTASQDLYINWTTGKWVEVSMTVPASHWNWLGSIAKSVQVS